jgi:hypothetical protein
MHIHGITELAGNSNIAGRLPMQAARAYGVTPQRPVASPRDVFQPSSQLQNLVAGKVSQAVSFEPTAHPNQRLGPAAVLNLYARSADRIEAAVGVELGRNLDVRG